MKLNRNHTGRGLALVVLALLSTLNSQLSTVFAQGSAFTYQGRLNDGGTPANGSYVFRFSLDDGNGGPVGSPVVTSPVDVSNGLFTVTLDFGSGIFTNASRRLGIAVHTNDNSSTFVALTPLQPILPTPYAIYASNAAVAAQAVSADSATVAGTATTASLAASVPWSGITSIPAGFADGVDDDHTYTAGPGLTLGGDTFSVNFAGSGSAISAARSDHNHFGASWSGDAPIGLEVSTDSSHDGVGVLGQVSANGGLASAGVEGRNLASEGGIGVYGASTNNGTGVSGETLIGVGVWGYASGTNGNGVGVEGSTRSPAGYGVYAAGSGASGTALAIDRGGIRILGAGANSSTPVFTHRATAGSISGHITTIDHPLANDDPNAILLVTHNYSADTSVTPYEPNTVGVWYNGSRWTIFHENTSVAMPVGRAFNVMIIKP